MAANAADSEPVTFGATIIDTTAKPQPALRSPPSHDSNMSANEKELGIDTTNPFSAFYKHPDASRERHSQEDANLASKTHLDVVVGERDLEAGLPLSTATTQQPKVSVDGRVKECTMWPSRQAVLDQKKKNRRSRGCNLFRNLNSKQRLWAKVIIALIIVAAAVGLGVGISRAVGGGVWSGQGQSREIPNN
ncbi:hypothetical protein EJ04DRAFT_210127 [Polyplosphaeria fusca]|uniref:Uncharacterized protein n=1 Tax=Polyplosphaeria fusca TaxID=682080 RepID=A0A9P4V719_9PLEO|nr:hypothetical protein EJ04DRAFT_210127 [Polyplosphaeria fusca]